MASEIEEILVSPLSGMVKAMGMSVADAASALALAQIELLKNRPDELVEAGVIPVFYHMQDVDVELKITVQLEEQQDRQGKTKWGLFGTPMNARYKNALKYEAEGSSSLKMRFAPGPPPIAVE